MYARDGSCLASWCRSVASGRVTMCGEPGGTEAAALPLLGLGLDEFSMAAPALVAATPAMRAVLARP